MIIILFTKSNHLFCIFKIFLNQFIIFLTALMNIRERYEYNLAHQIHPPISEFSRIYFMYLEWFFCCSCDEYKGGMIIIFLTGSKHQFWKNKFRILTIFLTNLYFFVTAAMNIREAWLWSCSPHPTINFEFSLIFKHFFCYSCDEYEGMPPYN